MVWYSHLFKNFPHYVVIHIGFSVVNEAEVDIFLEFPCFFYEPVNIGNLISGSSAFSKPSLYIWKFLIQVLLMPVLEDFEQSYSHGKWVQLSGSLNYLLTALLWDWDEE